jgi:hypothetical protein
VIEYDTNVRFICKFINYNTTSVQILFNNVLLNEQKNSNILYFTRESVTCFDAGVYTCKDNSKEEASIRLLVKCKYLLFCIFSTGSQFPWLVNLPYNLMDLNLKFKSARYLKLSSTLSQTESATFSILQLCASFRDSIALFHFKVFLLIYDVSMILKVHLVLCRMLVEI